MTDDGLSPEERINRARRGAALCRAALPARQPAKAPDRPLTKSEQIHALALERARTERARR